MCVRVIWFRTLQNCVTLSQQNFPQGQFQWFIDSISYASFVTDEIVYKNELQKIEIHEDSSGRTTEQSVVISSFRNVGTLPNGYIKSVPLP